MPACRDIEDCALRVRSAVGERHIFFEMPGGPGAQREAEDRHRQSDGERSPRRRGEPQETRPPARIRRARAVSRPRSAYGLGKLGQPAASASTTSSGRNGAHAVVVSRGALIGGDDACAAQHAKRSAVRAVARRIGGSENRDAGFRSAAARCSGPLSTPITACARRVASNQPGESGKMHVRAADSASRASAASGRSVHHQRHVEARCEFFIKLERATVSIPIRPADWRARIFLRATGLRAALGQRKRAQEAGGARRRDQFQIAIDDVRRAGHRRRSNRTATRHRSRACER